MALPICLQEFGKDASSRMSSRLKAKAGINTGKRRLDGGTEIHNQSLARLEERAQWGKRGLWG
jgi:hypothetical protein